MKFSIFSIWMLQLSRAPFLPGFFLILLLVLALSAVSAQGFYDNHEYSYREIILKPNSDNPHEKKRISRLAARLYRQLKANPASFARVARAQFENVSPYRALGGLRRHRSIYNIARTNIHLARVIRKLRPGQVSKPLSDKKGGYYIVKLEKKQLSDKPSAPTNMTEEQLRLLFADD